MFFTLLVLVAALALESLGSYISVIGLSQNTSIIIIILAVLLDVVKVIIATTLYKKWISIHLILKVLLVPSLLGLMLVTSSGTYGYLIKEFGKTSVGQEEIAVKVQGMQEEKDRIEARKKEIDSQISALPPNSVLQRKRLTDLFSTELNHINSRMLELDKSMPEANLQNIQSKSNGGNLATIANTYGLKAEEVTKVIAFLITLMIDPLAIVLLTISNFLMEQSKKERRENARKILNGEISEDDDSIMLQLKNKMSFLKSKTSKDSLDVSRFLLESKSQIIKKPLMNRTKEKLALIDFIYSTKLIENPKIIVPIKYSASIYQAIVLAIFKESRPAIIKIAPEKSFKFISSIEFIKNHSEILPTYVVSPLKRIRREFLEEEILFSNDATLVPIERIAEKSQLSLSLINFISQTKLVEPQEPFSVSKKEYLEEALFISADANNYKPVTKEIVQESTTHFITEVHEVNVPTLERESSNVQIDSFLNEVEFEVEEILHSKEKAVIHEFLLKDKPTPFKVVHKESVSVKPTEVIALKKNVFKKPLIKNYEQITSTSKSENLYTLNLDMPIEYTEPVIFHDEYQDFQIADLGDLVMQLWNNEHTKNKKIDNSEEEVNVPGFDIKEILNMKEIDI